MNQQDYAIAYPRKKFFIEMFTRDLSLIDCILDFIDNSIDGLINSNQIDLDDDSFLSSQKQPRQKLSTIKIKYDDNRFIITDNCGGIGYHFAKYELFNFGHTEKNNKKESKTRLGVYGIGLKRAIFKIGDYFEIESHSVEDGFITKVDSLKSWVLNDKNLND